MRLESLEKHKWKIGAATLVSLPVAIWVALPIQEQLFSDIIITVGMLPLLLAMGIELRKDIAGIASSLKGEPTDEVKFSVRNLWPFLVLVAIVILIQFI